jgi:hypothetical protein
MNEIPEFHIFRLSQTHMATFSLPGLSPGNIRDGQLLQSNPRRRLRHL